MPILAVQLLTPGVMMDLTKVGSEESWVHLPRSEQLSTVWPVRWLGSQADPLLFTMFAAAFYAGLTAASPHPVWPHAAGPNNLTALSTLVLVGRGLERPALVALAASCTRRTTLEM